MEWERDAAKAIERAPFFVRKLARRRVEQLVAAEGRSVITLDDVRRAKSSHLAAAAAPPEARPAPVASGDQPRPGDGPGPDDGPREEESGLSEAQIRRIEQLADTLAAHETRFYSVKGCGGAVGCPLTLVDGKAATDALTSALEASGLAEVQAKRLRGPVLSHHKLKIAVAGCPNSCSEPQIKDFALVARAFPARSSAECVECGACVAACREQAVDVGRGYPVFASSRCVGCGGCAEACPSGAIVVAKRGYDVLVGGRLGRHPRLALKVAEGATLEEGLAILDRCLKLMKTEALSGERLGQLLDRIGLDVLLA